MMLLVAADTQRLELTLRRVVYEETIAARRIGTTFDIRFQTWATWRRTNGWTTRPNWTVGDNIRAMRRADEASKTTRRALTNLHAAMRKPPP